LVRKYWQSESYHIFFIAQPDGHFVHLAIFFGIGFITDAVFLWRVNMSEYNVEIKQLVDFPRCRIYRQFIQQLIGKIDIRVGSKAGLFHYTVLCYYVNFRTSYKRIDGISCTVYPGQWLCRVSELTEWFRLRFHYPVELSCNLLGVSRAAYYRWLSGKKCARELENEIIAEIMEQIHTENPDKGYRRIKDDLAHDHKLNVNEKRVLRICRSLDIKSTIKYKNNGCTRQAANPQHIAKNWLNRQFHASMPDEK